MNKRIIIGSILVLTLLLLMPSIPAIQKNVTEKEIQQELQERLKEIDLEEIKSLFEKLKWQYPGVFILCCFLSFRIYRALIFATACGFGYYYNPDENIIIRYLLMARAWWLCDTADYLLYKLDSILHLDWLNYAD